VQSLSTRLDYADYSPGRVASVLQLRVPWNEGMASVNKEVPEKAAAGGIEIS
jgi:hypothetical protein